MIKRSLYILCLLLLGYAGLSAEPLRKELRSALETTQLLEVSQLEALDKALADSALRLPLQLGDSVQLLRYDGRSLSLQTSPVSRASVQLMPFMGKGRYVLVVEQVSSPQPDSRVSLLDSAGQVVTRPFLTLPTAEDFIQRLRLDPNAAATVRLGELLSPLHLELTWDDMVSCLCVRPSLLLQPEDSKLPGLQALIDRLPLLLARWSGKDFAPFQHP